MWRMTQRFLVVGDDPQTVRLLRTSLEQVDYPVFVAFYGKAVRQSYAKGEQS
jgi:CheY-like chemotaxis protein